MKLRIRGDNVCLRPKRSEVDRIAAGTSIMEDSVLIYRLDVSDNNDISARFDNGSLVVRLPKSKVLDWAGSDKVSLYTEQKHSDTAPFPYRSKKNSAAPNPASQR